MAHGFGAERAFQLPADADRFVDRGVAALLFDYRGFGDSEGPHQRVDPFRRRADRLAAVDGDRIGLWGTSFGGGHGVETAARRDVDAVRSQAPRRRNRDADPPGARLGTRLSAHGDEHGLRDAVRELLRLDPHTVPVVGPPAAFAMLNTPGAEAGYRDSPGRERLGDLPSGAGGATGAALQADFACRRGRRAAVPHRCEGRPHRTAVGGRTARPAARPRRTAPAGLRPRRRLPRGAVRARRRGAGGLPGPAPTVRPASAPARPALRSAPRERLSTAAAAPSMRRRRRRPARAAARTPG